MSVYRAQKRNTLVAHPVESPRMTRLLQWIRHPRRPLTPAAKRFIELMNNLLFDAVKPELGIVRQTG